MPGLVKEFREFILRGNLVDLAVAVVIGTAFSAVVAALVKDLITPMVAAVFGEPSFGDLTFTINGSEFLYGDLLNAVITCISIAAAVFFFVVKPVNELMARFGPKKEEDSRECPECLSEIPVRARRCAFCTSDVAAA
jgi:large conductance mechanosensitive channel